MIRLNLVTWNPLDECIDLERMDWYNMAMKYGWSTAETEESLSNDPDVRLVPVLVEKIILPKVTGTRALLYRDRLIWCVFLAKTNCFFLRNH